MIDTVCVIADSLVHIPSAVEHSVALMPTCWQWLAVAFVIICLIELIIILHLYKAKTIGAKRSVDKLRTQMQNDEPIDFTNVINSAFLSTELYDKMKVKCHPDRFVYDPAKQEKADDLFQRITQNRANYKALLQLKREAEETLNIAF